MKRLRSCGCMWLLLAVIAASLLSASPAAAEDTVELLSGAVVRGEVTGRTATDITVKSTIAGQAVVRKFPLDRLHAVTVGGQREVLKEKPGAPTPPSSKPASPAIAPKPIDPLNRRTREQVLAEIEKAGRTPPDWFATTPLSYPPTLDLTWPMPAPKGWNNQQNVGQYIWDVINPNPGRWAGGIKLLHHLLGLHQGNPATMERIQLAIAKIYYTHLNDYARAAYWYRTVGAENTDEFSESAVSLAECYFHLGSKDMASQLLARVSPRNSLIKAWTTLGETDKALATAKILLSQGPNAETLMYVGDAYRIVGRYDEALAAYQQVIDLGPPGNDRRLAKNQGRAQASVTAIQLFEKSDVKQVPDGVYTAQSLGYEGQVVVEVTVAAKRIASVRVVRHSEKQFYAALSEMPQRIIAKQSVKGVDTTSDATLTSEAIINATAKALAGVAK